MKSHVTLRTFAAVVVTLCVSPFLHAHPGSNDKAAGSTLPVKGKIKLEGRVEANSDGKRRDEDYTWIDEASPIQSKLVNVGGWNEKANSNGGRSGVAAVKVKVEQDGNGDAGAFYGHCQIGGRGNPNGEHWLSQPACVIINGDVTTTVPHSYLNVQEFSLTDNGMDVAGIGTVFRLLRSNRNASQGEIWMGSRYQSTGSKAVDVGLSTSGLFNIGVDTVNAVSDGALGESGTVSLNMAAGQKVVFNSSSSAMNGVKWYGNNVGTAYDSFSPSSEALDRCNEETCLSVTKKRVVIKQGGLKLQVLNVAQLPQCNEEAEGTIFGISDSKHNSFGAPVSAGGRAHVMAYCNGTSWVVH